MNTTAFAAVLESARTGNRQAAELALLEARRRNLPSETLFLWVAAHGPVTGTALPPIGAAGRAAAVARWQRELISAGPFSSTLAVMIAMSALKTAGQLVTNAAGRRFDIAPALREVGT